jgi:hypothetical protein
MRIVPSFALFLSFVYWTLGFGFLGCATLSDPSAPRGSAPAHPAAYSQDHFTYDKEKTGRAPNDFDFYYKHCSVDDRQPFPIGAIWQCTPP